MGHGAERRTAFPNHETQGHGAERRTAFSSHETQRLAPDRECTRYWWTYQRRRGNAGTMVLTHQRAPPARATNPKIGGRLTQAPVGTNPTTCQAAVTF